MDAARTRIILTLYIAAHGVRVAVAAHARQQEAALSTRHRTRAAGALGVTRPALHRLDAFELVAGAYVTAHFPAALAGEHREDVRASRIGEALAAWDVHAHRALTVQPTAGHLRMVAMTQELVLRHGAQILAAAATTGAIDPQQYTTRLQAPLEASRTAWASSAAGWSELAAHTPRPDAPALTTAAAEVRASLRAVTVDGPAPATALVLAQRTDLPQAARHVATALSASSDLAHLVNDVTSDPRLTFPARAVNAVAVAAGTTPSGGAVPGSPIGSAVAIRDLTANRPVPLPQTLRASFVQDADILVAGHRHRRGRRGVAARHPHHPWAGPRTATNQRSGAPLTTTRRPPLHQRGRPSRALARSAQRSREAGSGADATVAEAQGEGLTYWRSDGAGSRASASTRQPAN